MSSLTIPIRILRRPASPPVEFDGQRKLAVAAAAGDLGEKFGDLALGVARQAVGLAGKRVARQRLANGFDQRLRQARVGRHGLMLLRDWAIAPGL